MPNHVRNVIKISKIKPEEIEMVLDMVADKCCDPDVPGETKYMIDFDKIIPEPKSESDCPEEYKVNKDSHIAIREDKPWFDWYKWHINKWNTKWGAYDGYTNIGKTYILFVFNTAWAAPIPIYSKLAILNCDIDIKYANENYGVICGRWKYTSEHGWTYWNEFDFKDPKRFARDLWNNY